MYELKDHNVEVKSVFTGQHFDLIQPFISQFDIQTDYTISTFSQNQSMTGLLASILQQVDETIDVCKNDKWIVQGDTTSTFAVSVVAFLKKIPVYHVEAGLRTYNMSSPFPEEFYRKTVSSIASTHFAPTKKSAKALFAEGIRSTSVHIVGNTVIDMARIMRQKIEDTLLPFDSLDIHDRFIFMTMHRRENQDIMKSYYSTVGNRLKNQNVSVIVSVHPNPVSKSIAESACKKYSTFVCVDALDYMTTHKIMKKSHIVITDSGGLQEESTWYKKPVIVLRNTTERTEAIDAGVSVLATSVVLLQQYIGDLLDVTSSVYKKMSRETYPFGDGYAAKRIVNFITNRKNTKCAMSPIRQRDRIGSVIHDMMYAWAYAEANGLNYIGPFGQRTDLPELNSSVAIFELPWSLHKTKNNNCTILDPKNYRNEIILKSSWPSIRKIFKKATLSNTCAVHIRGGDVKPNSKMTGDYYRYKDDIYFLRLIQKHCGSLEVVIFSEAKGFKVKFWNTTGYTLKLSHSIAETWSEMIHSQVLITSASSFSYTPALFAQGTVIYTPFWHKPMHYWTAVTPLQSLPWKNVENTFDIIEKPCSGGQHGAIRPTVSTCILSPSTTTMFGHMPHAAQTLFNCWSLFQYHATENCNFVFADGLKSTPYAKWMIKHMGCFVVDTLPSRCAYISSYSANLRVDPGDTFSWFHNSETAQRLRENALFYLSPRIKQDSNIGIIRRRSNRKLILPEKQLKNISQVFFENISFDEQAIFFYEHKTILAAHGAAVIWSPFAQPNSTIIQVYPENYYPIGFYEPLIRESDSTPVTWWNGLTLGDENNVKWLNAFKLHYAERGLFRSKNIRISSTFLDSIGLLNQNTDDDKMISPYDYSGIPKKNRVTTCGASQFPSIDACSIEDTIDVFLTVFKRSTLAYQLDQVLKQTKRVSNIFVVQNENHVNITEILETWRANNSIIPIHLIHFGKNSRFHGRFFTAYMLSNAEYVSIWDDDINVGNRWLEYSIEQSKLHNDALVGANGRTLINIRDDNQKQKVYGTEGQKKKMHTCDFVGHVWTLKRELLRFYVGDIQFTYFTGEDMQLSRSLQKRGYSSIVPKMWSNGYYVFDTPETEDSHASYRTIKRRGEAIRERLFCQIIRDGFVPIMCSNCVAEKIDACISDLTSFIENHTMASPMNVGYDLVWKD